MTTAQVVKTLVTDNSLSKEHRINITQTRRSVRCLQSKVWSQFSACTTMSQWVHKGQLQFCPVIWGMFSLTRRTCISLYMWNIITVLENMSGESERRQRRTSGTKATLAWCLYSCGKLATCISIWQSKGLFFPRLFLCLSREWTENGQLWVQQVSSTPATRLDVVNLQVCTIVL